LREFISVKQEIVESFLEEPSLVEVPSEPNAEPGGEDGLSDQEGLKPSGEEASPAEANQLLDNIVEAIGLVEEETREKKTNNGETDDEDEYDNQGWEYDRDAGNGVEWITQELEKRGS
jgi:hypothetical protein